MLIGAWGEGAVDRLRRAADQTGAVVEQTGPLAIAGATGIRVGDWHCWLIGTLADADALARRIDAPHGSDATTLAAQAHARYGASAGERLRGAFVMVASTGEVAYVSSDALGSRPLVYASASGGVVFAEHERDLLELLARAPAPSRLAVTQWLENGCTPAGLTLYEGIHRVPAGHRLVLSARRVAVERYWRPNYEGVVTGSREALADRLREAAFAAVRRARGRSSRVAVRLSGGLDSACVAAGLANGRPTSPGGALALAAIFPEHPATDECELIQATARHTELALELIAIDDRASLFSPALEHIQRWRLPPTTPNMFIWEPLTARAQELGVDVVLDGEGGDELFGVAPYLIAHRLRRGRIAAAWSLTGNIPGIGPRPDRRVRMLALRRFGARALLPSPIRRRRRLRAASRRHTSLLATPDALAVAELEDSELCHNLRGPIWWRALAGALVYGREAFDVAGQLQRQASMSGMAHSHPFLHDVELLQTVLSTPPALQFDARRDRALLRDALYERIPEAVRTRYAKSYFASPLLAGVRAEGPIVASRLASPQAPIRSYLDGAALDRLLASGTYTRDAHEAYRLWRLGVIDSWLRAGNQPESLLDLRRELLRSHAR